MEEEIKLDKLLPLKTLPTHYWKLDFDVLSSPNRIVFFFFKLTKIRVLYLIYEESRISLNLCLIYFLLS